MISVIIPNFNYAHYLKQRIQSVLNQTYTDIEVILLDDCSTDNSLEVMREFSDSRIVGVFPNEVNTGSPFRQWQKGIEMAKGEYIWIRMCWCASLWISYLRTGRFRLLKAIRIL